MTPDVATLGASRFHIIRGLLLLLKILFLQHTNSRRYTPSYSFRMLNINITDKVKSTLPVMKSKLEDRLLPLTVLEPASSAFKTIDY